jgi:hypothetical protein
MWKEVSTARELQREKGRKPTRPALGAAEYPPAVEENCSSAGGGV